jgi:hypothetical protein
MGKKDNLDLSVDLTSLSDADLAKFEEDAVAEFDALDGDESAGVEGLDRMGALHDGIVSARTEKTGRVEQAAADAAKRAELRSNVHATEDADGEGETAADETAGETSAEPAAVTASAKKTDVRDVIKSGSKLNSRLAEASKRQPAEYQPSVKDQFSQSVLVASADVPGIGQGTRLNNMEEVVKAFQARGRSLPTSQAFRTGAPVYGEYFDPRSGRNEFGLTHHDHNDWRLAPRFPVISMERQFRHLIDDMASPQDAWDIMQSAARPESLVAAGGWCSPSEIRYDFYNIVGMDGAVDLPTTGIRRGGMRWPTSPSFGDLSASTGLWHWNETQDIAAATGTAQSGSKTCARVPCAAFNEARLEGEGICITAGNLTTDAWPEQIANFMRLVNAAHYHRVNTFFINQLVANSTAVSMGVTGQGVATPILDAIELQAIDLRAKYAMSDNTVMEAVFPNWIMGAIRADLAKRKGYDSAGSSFNITNAEIAAWFTLRNISAQFVQDYQVRATGFPGQSSAITIWPASVQFLMYPAGTWLRGNGLNLDLGIIRDSTLNATNDYTAAWSEEFFLLAKIGHESRVITVPITANGAVGADVTYSSQPL